MPILAARPKSSTGRANRAPVDSPLYLRERRATLSIMALDAIRKQFGSNAKAAARLREQWMRTKPGEARKMTVNSLATKIGDLARQQTDWWARRPVPTRLLADMLGCTELDLLGRPVVPAGSLDFPEFPALPPLRPDELPPRLRIVVALTDRPHEGRDKNHQR